ncbi:Rho termination factor N-terminal domain-containing protein [Prauserella oleivorans]|uniref:Rho termination factor N-terminal domain-containing protein n=1 Tax=Prauserella oleivorans TaxID=1478153 RepID=A0ABW5W4P6_9PSEU
MTDADTPQDTPSLQEMSMAELGDIALHEGIPTVQHMSKQELIEAIEQQRETNDVLRAEGETLPRSVQPPEPQV